MKTKFFAYALMLIIGTLIGSCSKSDTVPVSTTITFHATLNGASETPANASTATGTATFTYNTITYALTGTVTFQNITPSAGHIHKGAVGVPGGVIFPLGTAPFTSPINFASVTLDATQRADLLADLYYVNLHTTAFSGGEIRGQLTHTTTSGYTNTTGGGSGY